jgi:hypothetical protein
LKAGSRLPAAGSPTQDCLLHAASCQLLESVMANGEAIGLIETKGIVAAVEACDAALKAANVERRIGSASTPERSRRC